MDALTIVLAAFGLIGFAGGAVGYFAKNRGDSIIRYQATEIQLRDDRIARIEKDCASVTSERDSLLRERETLKGLAQGSPEISKLAKSIDKLTQTVLGQLEASTKKGKR